MRFFWLYLTKYFAMFKKILIALLLAILMAAGGLWYYALQNKPVYNGELKIKGLHQPVEVFFDEYGVPHIYAKDQHDAYLAFGYIHAQDRLWQMELLRRIAPGRLSEIFGADMIDVDKYFRGMGIAQATKRTLQQLDTTQASYQLAKAYLEGVNLYIKNGKTPVEFSILGIEKVPYTLEDVYNVFGYMSFSFSVAAKTDPLLSQLQEKLGSAYLKELSIDPDPTATLIHNYPKKESHSISAIAVQVNNILKKSPVQPFIGSNSWVVGPKKTRNKKVIFANDPHISFAQPAVWYQAHIVTPQYEMYGFHLGLTPFPLLGHNRNYAYGLTMFENDDMDFYYEPANAEFSERTEVIKVKGEEDVRFQVRMRKHRPVMNDFIETIKNEDTPVSVDWIYTRPDLKNEMLQVAYQISHANSLKEFKDGASKIHAPGLNVMYGDAKGNIAWFASAKLYTRKNKVNTKFVLDGSGDDDQLIFLDFKENPQAINPPWNYVYSANNQTDKITTGYYPGYYLPGDRARRIVDLIKPGKDFTRDDMMKMQLDVQSPVAAGLIKTVLTDLSTVKLSENEKKAIEILKQWKGDYKKEEIAPVIYNKFLYRFAYNTFADEMGDDNFEQFTHTMLFKRQLGKQIKKYKSVWWDDKNTDDIRENREEIFTRSFHESITALEKQFGNDIEDWTWSEAASVTHKHVFDKSALLRHFFNVGPFKTNGGEMVINNHIYNLTDSGIYDIYAGPSTRRVIDFSDVENSVAILPTGQSGNVFSKHYKDQAQKYLNGEFIRMNLNEQEIRSSEDQLLLQPEK